MFRWFKPTDWEYQARLYQGKYDRRVEMCNGFEKKIEILEKENEAMRKIICTVSDAKIKLILEK